MEFWLNKVKIEFDLNRRGKERTYVDGHKGKNRSVIGMAILQVANVNLEDVAAVFLLGHEGEV